MSAPIVKNRAKDHRPKVISFRAALDGLNIAARQNVLWPCHAFNISIPLKKKSGLNVFEETVLRITEIESGDTDRIALLTCLEKELVAFIQNRLNQLGLLNNRYELSEEGKKLLKNWRNKDDASVEYTAGTVFVDLHSGKLLPYIHIGNLTQEKVSSIKWPSVLIELGSTGQSKPAECHLISHSKQSYWKSVPNSNDIIRAIREFKKKYKRHALLNHGVDQYPPPVPMAEAISINENPELVYLHCQALIQIGNSDLLVTDGCGFGFSESFANYLTFQNSKWITNLKQKGIVDKVGNAGGSGEQSSRRSYKYAGISRRIQSSKKALQKVTALKVDSTYYESDFRQEVENGIKNLYAALEWVLRQVVADAPMPEWEQIFDSGNFRDNEKLLIGFANKVGFAVNQKNKSLLQVKAGAIRQIEHGKVELQPLLALGIAGASSNANHPVHRLAQNHSGFLSHALKLKKYRDPIEHGSTAELNVDEKTLRELIETMTPMIISLVPGVADDLDEVDRTNCDRDINQERLKATVELEKAFGVASVSEMTPNVKEQFMRSDIMLTNFTGDKAVEIIKCYASIIQHVLFDAMKDRRLEKKNKDMRDRAVENIVQGKFYPGTENVPQEITTVAPHNIRRAVQGSSTTLGAHLLAVFLLGSENELIQLQKSDPTFVDFVANLIRLRGHGNKQQSDLSRDDMESLKNNVFKAIKIITEVF